MRGEIKNLLERLPWHKVRRWSKRPGGRWGIKRIAVHCTGSGNQDPYKTNRYHVAPNHISKRGCPRLCYHEFIAKDGTCYPCNVPEDKTWHVGLFNRGSYGIVMAFAGQREAPSIEQVQTLLERLVRSSLMFKVSPARVLGHREFARVATALGLGRAVAKKFLKACPGNLVNMDAVRLLVCLELQHLLREAGLYDGGIDGKFGKLSLAALQRFNYAEEVDVIFSSEQAAQVIRRS